MAKINKRTEPTNVTYKDILLGSKLNDTEYGTTIGCSVLNGIKLKDIVGDINQGNIHFKLALEIDGEKADTFIQEPTMHIFNEGVESQEIHSTIIENAEVVIYDFTIPTNLEVFKLDNKLYKAKYYIDAQLLNSTDKIIILTGNILLSNLKEEYLGII